MPPSFSMAQAITTAEACACPATSPSSGCRAMRPELNSAENIWEYLRKNKLANTVFDSYDDIVDKACEAWLFFANDKTSVTTITAREWATVSS